ncbi:hypothetical protein Taro_020147 [Colocasia esculenta]|uniref:Uncharacterized protein n=1 Tax=Colocasia esculenta TaxID=4460 RepID=A0A843V1A9_COLES|nr:hypothetical protein [Colocasia esculenta]
MRSRRGRNGSGPKRDRVMRRTRRGGQIRQQGSDGALHRVQNATGFSVVTRPQNVAYRAVTFTGSTPDSDRERTCSWIAVQNCLILTQGASKIENKLYRVAADEKGKKMSFLWSFHSSSATKSSSTRP